MFDLGPLRLDLDRHRVVRPDGVEPLTRLEVEALRCLLAQPGEVVSRARLETEVWGHAARVRSQAVPVAMRRLRQKLGDAVIEVVRGEGWRIVPPPRRAAAGLPSFATPFVGREALLRAIGAAFDGEWRLVTLRGPGGVGKTRAALQFAAGWPGEVVAVSLLGTPPDRSGLYAALADALGLAHGDAGALRRGLGARDRPLLVLDDADEAAASIAEAIGELVRDAPGARVLVTSRVALDLREEALIEVPPFPPAEARAFLVARMRGIHPDPEGEPAALDALVGALDGLPGALELYASRAWAGLGPLVEELVANTQDATLDAGVRRSWEALDERARDALLACSGFAGAFPAEAARVAGVGAPILGELRRRSLVQLEPGGRLFLLATVRRFCARQEGAAAARAPAYAWVLDRAEAACEALARRPVEALAELRALRPHLLAIAREAEPELAARAVLATSAALGCTGPSTLRRALLEGVDWSALPRVWSERGRVDLARARRAAGVPIVDVASLVAGVRTAEGALVRAEHAVASGDVDGALREFAAAVELAPESDLTHVLARVRRATAQALHAVRAAEENDADLALAEAACARHGLALPLPDVLRAVAAVRMHRGEAVAARASLGRALTMAEAWGLSRQVGDLWNNLGQCWFLDESGMAEASFERAVAHAEAQGDDALAAVFQLNLALARLVLDRPAEALRLLDDASRVLRSPVAVQFLVWLRASALFALGRTLEARVALAALDRRLLGSLFSPEAARHGELLARFAEAEERLRSLEAAPEEHAPPLRALLADAEGEAARPSVGTLQALAKRVAARLARVS